MKSLIELYQSHQGKVSDKWEIYLREYDRLFSPYRDRSLSMLEIGIQNGGSLEIWSQYFANAEKLVGCDINPDCGNLIYDDPRITFVIGDANADETQAKILSHSDRFDLIIDDGSHTSGDIVRTFVRYFPYLKEGGLFIVEDLHCSYWKEFEGGLFYPFSSIAFFKRLIDVINQEHWQLDKSRSQHLSEIQSHFSVDLSEELLSQLHAVEFTNSICVVHKTSSDLNTLGERIWAGQEESIVLRDQFGVPDQTGNNWSNLELSPEESFEQLLNNLAELENRVAENDAQIAECEAQIAGRDAQIATILNSTSWWLTKPVRFFGKVIRKARRFFVLLGVLFSNFNEIRDVAVKLRKSGLAYAEYHLNLLQSEEYLSQVSRNKGISPEFLKALVVFGTGFLIFKHWVAKNWAGKYTAYMAAFFRGEISSVSEPPAFSHIRLHIDRPNKIFNIFDNYFAITGWCVDLNTCSAAKTRVRVGKVIHQPYLVQREEVAFVFAAECALPKDVGFVCVPWIPKGLNRMWIDVQGADGSWIAVRRFLILDIPWLFGGSSRCGSYASWVNRDQKQQKAELSEIKRHIDIMTYKPLFTVILDTRQNFEGWKISLQSIHQQIYPHYEFCVLANIGVELPHPLQKEVKLLPGNQLTHVLGDFIILLEGGQRLSANALYEFANALNQNPELDLIYGDEDCLNSNGKRCNPFYKPDWSPDYLETFNYIGFPACFRTKIANICFNDTHRYDFVLLFTERTTKVKHVAKILGHEAKRIVDEETLRRTAEFNMTALRGRLERTGRRGAVREHELYRGCYDIELDLKKKPLVSIIIPTAGKIVTVNEREIDLILNVVDQIRNRSSYCNLEIIVVDNGDLTGHQLQILTEHDCRLITYVEPIFNISKKLNLGASIANGELIVLMNDDIELLTASWIERMVEHFEKPHVGAVGAKLLYPDGRTQHVGVVSGNGNPDHVRRLYPGDEDGYFYSTCGVRNFMAVTGAVIMTSAKIYREVGGFSEELSVNFNDVDFCLKVQEKGFWIVYAPRVVLTHMESQSHVVTGDLVEVNWFRTRWAVAIVSDPYYNEQFMTISPPTFTPHVNI